MLAIWSRARRNPGTCRCISRVSNTTAVSRRSGQAALRGAWVLGSPTSTFLYTTVFAAGLAIDAKAKAKRNRQWEEAFAHLRESMHQRLHRERLGDRRAITEPIHPATPLEDLPDDLDWSAVERIAGMELFDEHVLQDPAAQAQVHDALWDDLRFDSKLPGVQPLQWPVNTGHHLVRHHLPPQSLWAPDSIRLTAMRRRHTWKKLAMQQLSTGLMIHTLLGRDSIWRHLDPTAVEFAAMSPQLQELVSMTDVQARQARERIRDSIARLHTTAVDSAPDDIKKAGARVDQAAIPSYVQDPDGDFHAICLQMNEAIRQILGQDPKENDRVEAAAVAKICHNLLVSTAAPDVQTFNLLLSGFKHWRRPYMVDDVIAALYTNKIRPNEITCREILGHYVHESRPDDFARFVAKMRGVGDSLMLADPNITINEAGQGRLVRASGDKVYQKVYPTPMVFGSLVSGVMKFAGFDRALDIYYEMKADGWGLDIQGLIKLLRDCIRRADWQGGIYLWEEVNSIKVETTPQDMAILYYHMLSLCSVTGNTVAFNQVLNEVASKGFDRKSIISAATKMTRWAQTKGGHVTPAWVADNVLIAVSDYVNDARSSTPNMKSGIDVHDDTMFTQDDPDSDVSLGKHAMQVGDAEKAPADPHETWASWVEHEFGERPKDPEP